MKNVAILIVVAFIAGVVCIGPTAATEFRGLWVDAFHQGFKSPEETSEMVARAKECGFNALIVQVRKRGDVYYKSSIEQMAPDVAGGYDPLADVVAKARAAGMEVHAWVTCFEVYHDTKWSSVEGKHVYLKHPEWLMKDGRARARFPGDKVFLDPGVPEAREYLASIVAEIAKGYRVDGIHLDSVRYPSQDGGYNELSLARFSQEKGKQGKPAPGDADWGDWRRAQLTEFVRLVRENIRKGIKLSACVPSNRTDAYYNQFQDWAGWLKAGLLDFAVPMVFPMDDRVFQSVAADVIRAAGGKTVYIGQGGWRLPAEKSARQLDTALGLGAPGVVVYSYNSCCRPHAGDKTSLMDTLRSGLFARSDGIR